MWPILTSDLARACLRLRDLGLLLLLAALAGCDGQQSALNPAGAEAQRIATLFWWMTGGALAIWMAVMGIALYVTQAHPEAHGIRSARWLILGGGIVFPVVVLTGLLIYGLMLMSQLRPSEDVALRIEVSGEQWWWRVRYRGEAGEAIELANEIRLPVGERVAFSLTSPDVIHSFWVPSLGGKVDMIPGRTNELVLEPTRTGTFGGVCAEYCGTSHALMKLVVVVMPRDEFDQWLAAQAEPARVPASELQQAGQRAFLANGCGACHQVRGTEADGTLGPDLTHVGSRLSLAAGTLPADVDAFQRWIGHTGAIKPDVRMPAFGMLPEVQLSAMAHYLSGLK
ncbi:cytochrome c oxidase subunit II [Stutzerimonas nosocomialis]|uniref:Cytochrome aa3 subunit 2 n=1 Tax=Stutzerimonas nosocomialis TaxID=1056496 RepID=A0A5R9QES2_9GAMM|nr:cytochrome c oxidase subunit II [Stutzerimonas nosocomialis]TLX54275.1 cytochrome c oxidase subunit II [Stutzerimonas nosocomialis]TLX58765.1 cytochrome c oxidase subunit II [Stutzerimonas nosocomialis]TLX63263.1 cytochrome c oxidase subunit II [Stutzerimonas nosocomialis]